MRLAFLRNLFQNLPAGGGGIGSSRHLASNDNVIGAIANGFGRGCDTFLIAGGGARGANTGNYYFQICAGYAPNPLGFERRTDDSIHP